MHTEVMGVSLNFNIILHVLIIIDLIYMCMCCAPNMFRYESECRKIVKTKECGK